MPIKNKDGTPFKLQGINPLMKDQDHWDNWVVHYVEPELIVIKDPHMTFDGLPEEAPMPVIIGVGAVKQTEVIYCLPLIITYDEDPIYGQKKKITSWGEKFSFEAVRIDYTGLTATFFARFPKEIANKMERGSIIYVFKERQWWKVNGIEASEDGFRIYCMPSEVKPSFV